MRAGRCHLARRLRAATGPLSRRYRDHAAGGAALHLRPLCRRAPMPAHPQCPEPDRRRRRARHRSGGDPRVDRRPVRFNGKGRGDRYRGARDAADHPQDQRAAVRFLVSPGRAAQIGWQARPAHLRGQGQRVQGLCLLSQAVRRMRRAPSRSGDRSALCRCLLGHAGAPALGLRCPGDGEHVRRHPLRSHRRPDRGHGHGPVRRHRRRARRVSTLPRHRPRHHGNGARQSHRHDSLGGTDAGLARRPARPCRGSAGGAR